METYTTEIRDGHHFVRMFSDEEIELRSRVQQVAQDMVNAVHEMVKKIVDGITRIVERIPEPVREKMLEEQREDKPVDVLDLLEVTTVDASAIKAGEMDLTPIMENPERYFWYYEHMKGMK